MSFSPNSRLFGLEIGTDWIRAMAISRSYFGDQVVAVNELPLSRSPWLKNGLRDKSQLVELIQRAAGEALPKPIKLNKVAIALPESTVFSKALKLPKVSTKELIQSIPYEAGELLPLPLEEMYLDWQIDHDNAKLNDDEIRVFAVAAPKVLVDELQQVVSQAGLQLVALESQPFCAARALRHQLSDERVAIMLIIDETRSTLAFTTQSAMRLASVAEIGRRELSGHTSAHLKLLADEINESIKYYHNRLSAKEPVKKLIVAGAGAGIAGLAERLGQLVDLPAEIAHPHIRLPHNRSIHPRFTVCLGLALREQA